jgi:hypothetical protein
MCFWRSLDFSLKAVARHRKRLTMRSVQDWLTKNAQRSLQFAITRMHVGSEPLLVDDFPAQSRQRVALCCGQAGAEVGFVFGGQLGKLFEHPPAAFGEDEFGMATIFGVAFPLDQPFFCQLINQNDHATRKHAKPFRQHPLIAGSGSDDAQDSRMVRSNAQSFNSLAKTIGGVGAELSEEKSGAGGPLFAGFHEACGQLKQITCRKQ